MDYELRKLVPAECSQQSDSPRLRKTSCKTGLFQWITEKRFSQLRLSLLLRTHAVQHSVRYNLQVKSCKVNKLNMFPDSSGCINSGKHHEIHCSLSHILSQFKVGTWDTAARSRASLKQQSLNIVIETE